MLFELDSFFISFFIALIVGYSALWACRIKGMETSNFPCGNHTADNPHCTRKSTFACRHCHLVSYCSGSCQKAHWPQHKQYCVSPHLKPDWKPRWVTEKRLPSFATGSATLPQTVTKCLWGDTPAFDLLQLEHNEGSNYTGDLSLLFAASGDLRNVVKTIAVLPNEHSGSLEIFTNDRDFDVVGRNVIILLVALSMQGTDRAVECIIHLWYSVLIRKEDLQILHSIRPRIERVCKYIDEQRIQGLCTRTFEFGKRKLRVVLDTSSWKQLLSFFDVPAGLTAEQAQAIRRVGTLPESRRDYLDRYLYCQLPSRRVADIRFRKDGLLLPFSYPRDDFCIPNPTIFKSKDLPWPMTDSADPLHGWPSEEVAVVSTGPATSDIYGKLYFYLRDTLRAFHRRLKEPRITFTLAQMDIADLCSNLKPNSLSRIEVSNIADHIHEGVQRTLTLTMPLLQRPTENPHATLVALFQEAIPSMIAKEIKNIKAQKFSPTSVTSVRVMNYLNLENRPMGAHDPDIEKFSIVWDFIASWEGVWKRYAEKYRFEECEKLAGVVMKEAHTVVDKWPGRLKLHPWQRGAQAELYHRLGDGTAKTRFVEWKRVV